MSCTIHPENVSVGTCVSCGRSVCETCCIRFNNLVHCRECVEAGLVKGGKPAPQGPAPGPMGPPGMPPMGVQRPMVMHPAYARLFAYVAPTPLPGAGPGWFKGGAITFVIAAVSCFFVTGVMYLSLIGVSIPGSSSVSGDTLTTVVFFVHLPFYFIAPVFLGLQKNYGIKSSSSSFLGFMLLNTVSMVLWALIFLRQTTYDNDYSEYYSLMPFLAPIMLGLAFIFLTFPMKAAMFSIPPMHPARKFMGWSQRGLLVAGILFVFWIGLYFFGWIAAGIAFIIGARALLKAPMPDDPMPQQPGPYPQPAPAYQPAGQAPPPRY